MLFKRIFLLVCALLHIHLIKQTPLPKHFVTNSTHLNYQRGVCLRTCVINTKERADSSATELLLQPAMKKPKKIKRVKLPRERSVALLMHRGEGKRAAKLLAQHQEPLRTARATQS